MHTITIIGAGNMGGAMAEKLLETEQAYFGNLVIEDPKMLFTIGLNSIYMGYNIKGNIILKYALSAVEVVLV